MIKTLYDPAQVSEIKDRLAKLRPESPRQWGTMNASQAVAHCSGGMELALGDLQPPRLFIGRVIGGLIKPLVFRDNEPMRRNSPTVPCIVVTDQRELGAERERLARLIDRFASGPEVCTRHPHAFFGKLTAEQWAILSYKHLDHHLRQFGA